MGTINVLTTQSQITAAVGSVPVNASIAAGALVSANVSPAPPPQAGSGVTSVTITGGVVDPLVLEVTA